MLDLIRRRIAPPRFVLFAGLLAATLAAGLLAGLDVQVAALASFDLATAAFLLSIVPLLNDAPSRMRVNSARNDANRAGLLAITLLVLIVVLLAIGALVAHPANQTFEIPLVLGSLTLAWCFANTVFALHYAHLYYQQSGKADRGGLAFPGDGAPGYYDFLYFSFTLGMTFQTSDVSITGPHMRRIALIHSISAFFFNLGILAFAINIVGSLSTSAG